MNELHVKLGQVLQLERQRKNLKLEDISEELKITIENLKAIEEGDASKIPTDLYYKLFSKSYAEKLGIDYNRTIEAIQQDIGNGDYANDKKESSKEKSTEKSKNSESVETDSEESQEEPSLTFGKKLLMSMGAVVVVSIILLGSYKIFLAPDTTSNPNETSGEENSQIDKDEKDKAEFASFDWSNTKYPDYENINLLLKAREESWATVVADGDTVIYRSLIPYRDYNVSAKYRIVVSIGVPSRVDVTLNGTSVNLRNPETRRISRVEINQVNLNDFVSGTFYDEASQTPQVINKPETAVNSDTNLTKTNSIE